MEEEEEEKEIGGRDRGSTRAFTLKTRFISVELLDTNTLDIMDCCVFIIIR